LYAEISFHIQRASQFTFHMHSACQCQPTTHTITTLKLTIYYGGYRMQFLDCETILTKLLYKWASTRSTLILKQLLTVNVRICIYINTTEHSKSAVNSKLTTRDNIARQACLFIATCLTVSYCFNKQNDTYDYSPLAV